MSGLEIIRYEPGFKDEVAKLLTLLVHPDPGHARRYLEWKYEQNPYIRTPTLYLVRSEGRIVGMRGLLGTSWQVGEDSRHAAMPYPDDHVVTEDMRGSGVATLLMRAVLDDAAARGDAFLCNLSAGMVTALASLAAGWKRVGVMEQVARVQQPVRLARLADGAVNQSERLKQFTRGKGWGPSSAAAFVRLDRGGEGPGVEGSATIVVEQSPRPEAMALLVDRLGHDGRIRHVRDATYLTWRYRHPIHEYRFLCHERGGRLDGYLVLQRTRFPRIAQNRVGIVDWEAEDDRIAAALLARAIEWGAFSHLGAWASTLPGSRIRLLAESGFEPFDLRLRARGLPGILVIQVGAKEQPWVLHGRPLLDLAQWDVRRIYSMQG